MPRVRDIEQAAQRLRGVARRTRLERSRTFSEWTGSELHLKFENRQRTGSFKIRGAYNRLATMEPDQLEAGVVAASAGNHAQALACAARMLGAPARLYMPIGASLAKLAATSDYGGEVRLVDGGFEEAVAAAQEAVRDEGRTLVHAFDDELVIAGQGTLGLELAEDLPELDTVVVPLGGGGLASGVAIAVKDRVGAARVVGVQVQGYAPYLREQAAGDGRPAPGGTLADGIAIKQPGDVTRPLVDELLDDVVTVTEAEIASAMVHLLEREKAVVEGAGAAGLAAVLSGKVRGAQLAVVLSGGNIDTPRLMQVIRFGLTDAGRYLVVRTRVGDRPGQLMRLLQVVADANVNILFVGHHREGVDISVSETGIELTIETKGEEHAEEVVGLLREGGYPVTRVR